MSEIEDYCKICGDDISDNNSTTCEDKCIQKLEDTEIVRIRKPGQTVYFYQSPDGPWMHQLWPNGIDSWEVLPGVSIKEFDKAVEKANTPGYGYETVELSETPLDEVEGVEVK